MSKNSIFLAPGKYTLVEVYRLSIQPLYWPPIWQFLSISVSVQNSRTTDISLPIFIQQQQLLNALYTRDATIRGQKPYCILLFEILQYIAVLQYLALREGEHKAHSMKYKTQVLQEICRHDHKIFHWIVLAILAKSQHHKL